MTRRNWTVIVLAMLLTAAVFWPAHSMKGSLKELSDGRLQLLNIQGSIWRGYTDLGLSDGGKVFTLPGQLSWSPKLFADDIWLGIEIDHQSFTRSLHLGVGSAGYHISEGQARLPASWLSSLGAPFNTIQPEGVLQLSWEEVDLVSGDFALKLIWRDAQSALSSIRPLGEYRVDLKGQVAGPMDLTVRTVSGSLKIDGQGSIAPGQRMQFKGYAWADEDSRAALTGLLSQMGRLENGKYRLGVF